MKKVHNKTVNISDACVPIITFAWWCHKNQMNEKSTTLKTEGDDDDDYEMISQMPMS